MSWRVMRRVLVTTILLTLLASAAVADSLYLKNGSVLKGTFIGYENGQFIFELADGQRVLYRPAEVTRLVIENNLAGETPRNPVRNEPPPPRAADPGGGKPELYQPFEVKLEGQWVRSPVVVARGQRIRIGASGSIFLEGQTPAGPNGIKERRDPESPMPNANDGALLASIGQDQNSPPIYVGQSREFIADRSGTLYFTVNHGETRNARGSFRVNVAVDRSGGSTTPGDSGRSTPGQSTPGSPGQGQREKIVTVAANQPWTDTGIDVTPNMAFEFIAEGQINLGNGVTSGAEGTSNATTTSLPFQQALAGALIGKIQYRDGGDSNFVGIGANGTANTEPDEYGRLFLGINDDYFRDNSGTFRVTIRY
jgi:hypothetical protein